MYFMNGWYNYISNISHLSWNIFDVKSAIYVIDERLFAIGARAKLSSFANSSLQNQLYKQVHMRRNMYQTFFIITFKMIFETIEILYSDHGDGWL